MGKGENAMATKTAGRPEADSSKRISRSQAAAKIASLVEEHMTECGFSEEQKTQKVAEFGKRVDKTTARSAKP
jgi:hypothetical protein